VIFVTVGTHQQRFDRLLDALPDLEGDVFVQFGPGPPPAGVARAEAFMSFDAVLRAMREAEVVITHAGVGSILCAIREGHVPVVVPRRREHGEHVDDHQVELTQAMERRGSVIAVWDMADLPRAVASAPPRAACRTRDEPLLCSSVREALLGS
jgi:UDP-N-acetylglucosamine--N-acetylmuramyl-(pentapeptide) pyrophosphoryl-undecaprenol N-acetylglucosamine transferase